MKKNLLILMLACVMSPVFAMENQERNRVVLLGCLGGAVAYLGIKCVSSWFDNDPDVVTVIQGSQGQFNNRFDALHKSFDALNVKFDEQSTDCSRNQADHVKNFATMMQLLSVQQEQISELKKALIELVEERSKKTVKDTDAPSGARKKESEKPTIMFPR